MIEVKIRQSNHPSYSAFTLFTDGSKGFGVIQQRYNPQFKCTWWGPIDQDLTYYILHSPFFDEFWDANARAVGAADNNVIEVRKVMWGLHMKPLKKELWETKF